MQLISLYWISWPFGGPINQQLDMAASRIIPDVRLSDALLQGEVSAHPEWTLLRHQSLLFSSLTAESCTD